MGIFDKLTTEGMEEAQDVLGGGQQVPSGIYPAKVKLMYLGKSGQPGSEAQSITIHADIGGTEFRETIWFTNRNGDNFYIPKDAKDGKVTKSPLPGFTTIDDICLLGSGEGLVDQEAEEKVVKLYDFSEKKELPKNVMVLTSMIGKEVKLGILRQIVDKQKLNKDTKKYENTGDTRTENTISKVFHSETDMTVAEYRREATEPEFMPAWKTKNDGKDINRAKGAKEGAGSSGSGRPGGTKKLSFGK